MEWLSDNGLAVSGLVVCCVGVMCIEELANIILSYLDYSKQESELIRNRNRLNINDFEKLLTINYIRRNKQQCISLITDNLYSVRYMLHSQNSSAP